MTYWIKFNTPTRDGSVVANLLDLEAATGFEHWTHPKDRESAYVVVWFSDAQHHIHQATSPDAYQRILDYMRLIEPAAN